ncbi:hypothetical protein CX854_22375 [Salmonella enterica subsp. enterica serovar Kentucky]|nr:hypothetical protein [Salmonella enterica subsp. enterica serovar Kentucky]
MIRGKIDILVVDDDVSHCTILQALLRGWGYNVALAYSGHDALAQVREKVFDLVLCDVRMAEMDGIATLKEIKALNPAIPILIMTAFSSVETAVEALKAGALDYLIKPLDFDRLQETLEKALAHTRETGAELPSASAAQFGMIGSSPAMQHLLNEIAMVAPSDATVLIHYDWPGNIRELENAIERAVVLLTGEYISERELPLAIAATPIKTEYSGEIQPLVDVEKEVILAALEKTGGNKTEAARQLGITRKTLLAKLSR